MRPTRKRLIVLLLVALAPACKPREAPRAPDLAPSTPPAPSWKSDVAPVLERMCARARGCHGADATHSVDLDLRAGAAWAQLVGQPAEARRGALRVQPGDPKASFLVDKLAGRLGPQEGKSMPLDVNTGQPIVPPPLADWTARILTPWIAAGAPEN